MTFRRPRLPASERGYDADHRRARAAYLAAYRPHHPCCLCGRPLGSNPKLLHLDHHPAGGYRGLAHARCNIRDGARRGARTVNLRRTVRRLRTSRDW